MCDRTKWYLLYALAACSADTSMPMAAESGEEGSSDGKEDAFRPDGEAPIVLLADGERGKIGGLISGFDVLTYAADPADVGPWKGALVVSPGGFVSPSDMESFSRAAARDGYVAVVISYVANAAATPVPGNRERSVTAARAIREAFEAPKGDSFLPDEVTDQASAGLPVYGFGHSLGAAALGAFGPYEDGAFDGVVLFGASRLLRETEDLEGLERFAPVELLVGENDTVALRADEESGETLEAGELPARLLALESLFGTETELVDGVNHFCFLPENAGVPAVPVPGAPNFRPLDSPAVIVDTSGAEIMLTQEDCAARVVDAMDAALLPGEGFAAAP